MFVSLDEDDAKTFTDAINAIQDVPRHLTSIMKDNVHVLTSTIPSFNNTISKLNENEYILNDNIKNLGKILDSVLANANKL